MTRRAPTPGAVAVAALLWAAGILAAYYVYHKPVSPEQAASAGRTLWAALVAGAIALAGAGSGRRAAGALAAGGRGAPLERLVLESALGLGLLGLAWLGLGLAGALRAPVAWAVLSLLALAVGRPALAWLRDLRAAVGDLRPRGRVEWLLAGFVAFMAGVALLNALAPPTAWDALLYHLTGPRADLAAGHLRVDPWLPETGYPQGVELLYAWAMLLGSDRAPAVIHWVFGMLTLLLVWGWGREAGGGARAGWLACAVLLSAATYPGLMGWAYTDAATSLYASAALAAALRWRESGRRPALALAGVLAGLAFGTKYTAGVVGLALGLVFVASQPRQLLRNALALGLPALAVALPWLVKNALLAGNPFYPFLFAGRGWDGIRAAWYSQTGTGLLASDPTKLLTAPFIMSLLGAEGTDVWHATLGPLFLMLLPAAALGWRARSARRWLRDALLFALVLYLCWLAGAATSRLLVQPRLLLPVLPPLAVVAAVGLLGLRALTLPAFSVYRVTLAAVLLTLALTAVQAAGELLHNQVLPVLAGTLSEEDYRYQRLGWYYGALHAVQDLPAGSRVLFLFEPRTYFCPPDRCLPDGILDNWYHARRSGGTAADLAAAWRGQGISHVLVYALGARVLQGAGDNPFAADDWRELAQLQTGQMHLLENFGDAYLLYTLTPP